MNARFGDDTLPTRHNLAVINNISLPTVKEIITPLTSLQVYELLELYWGFKINDTYRDDPEYVETVKRYAADSWHIEVTEDGKVIIFGEEYYSFFAEWLRFDYDGPLLP